MSFLDEFKYNFSDIKDAVSDVSKKIKSDSKQLKKIAKIRYEIAVETKNLNGYYKELGRYYYRLNKGIGTQDFDMTRLIEQIDMTLARIESLNIALNNTNFEEVTRELTPKDEYVYFDHKDLK